MGHLLWGAREEVALDAELLKDLVLPEGQSFWLTCPPLHDLVFLKTEWNSSHLPWAMALGEAFKFVHCCFDLHAALGDMGCYPLVTYEQIEAHSCI